MNWTNCFSFLLLSLFYWPTICAQPANDNACDALEIQLDAAAVVMSNAGATVQMGEEILEPPYSFLCEPGTWCDPAIHHSLWFKFIAPSTTAVEIDLCGSTFNTQLALYEASDCADFASYTLIWATDDQPGCANGLSSTLRMECLEPGGEYMVLVDNWQAAANDPIDEGEVSIFISTKPKIDPGVSFIGTFEVRDPICPGGDEGYIIARLIAGVEPISIEWSNGVTELENRGIAAGVYRITATDFCGTSQVAEYELLDPSGPKILTLDDTPYDVVHPTHCGDGAYGGQILPLLDDNLGELSFRWSTGDSTGLISGLSDGAYTVSITGHCGINTLEKTYYLGMNAGPDIKDFEGCKEDYTIGLDHANTGGEARRITYSTNQSFLSGIACRIEGGIGKNATWRSFDLANDFGITEMQNLKGVEVFITSTPAGDYNPRVPLRFTAYSANTPLLDDPNLELIELERINIEMPEIPNYSSYIIPFQLENIDPTKILVIKVETLSNHELGHRFDFAMNATPTIQGTYISSEDCGIDHPVTLASVGFNQQLIMNLFLANDTGGLSYQWEGEGIDDPSSPTPMVRPTGSQAYQVTITDEACGIIVTDLVTVICGGLNTTELPASLFTLHPNPTNGLFQLSGMGALQKVDCELFNAQGQKVDGRQSLLGEGNVINYDLNTLPVGIYWLSIATEEGRAVKRLIVQ